MPRNQGMDMHIDDYMNSIMQLLRPEHLYQDAGCVAVQSHGTDETNSMCVWYCIGG
jgi:hypothetical protein